MMEMENVTELCFAERLKIEAKQADKKQWTLALISLGGLLLAELAYFLPLFYPFLAGIIMTLIMIVGIDICLFAFLKLIFFQPTQTINK